MVAFAGKSILPAQSPVDSRLLGQTTLEGFDAEAVRAQDATTHVSGPYVEASDLNMAGPNLVVGDEQHLPTRGHIPKGERAELRDIGVVENGDLVVGGQDGDAV